MKYLILIGCLLAPCFAQIELNNLIMEEDAGVEEVSVVAPDEMGHGSAKVEKRAEDRLTFLDEDTFGGSLMAIDGEAGILWRHPDAADPIRFLYENVKEILLQRSGRQTDLETFSAVSLTNGDVYQGEVVSMNSETLTLDTLYAGRVRLATPMIEDIRPEQVSTSIYEGPTSLEEWEISGKDDWIYRDGALYCPKGNDVLGLKLNDFPDRAKLTFELAWKGNLQFQASFWGNDPKQSSNENYTLMLQSSYVRMYRYSKKHGRQDLGNTHFSRLRNLTEARITLYLDREEKEIRFYLDDELIKTWKDTIDGEIRGKAFSFRAVGSAPVRIRDIQVRQWDGTMNDSQEMDAGSIDRMELKNGDMYSGTLRSVQDGVYMFENDLATLNVPSDRVERVRFAKDSRQTPRLRPRDIRVWFPGGRRITLALSGLNNGIFHGSSEAVGEIDVQVPMMDRMIFNPYDERHEKDDEIW